VNAVGGRGDAAARWADAAAAARDGRPLADGTPSLEPWLAVVRAALARGGVDRLRADADAAEAALGADSPWRPAALLLQGVARALAEDAPAAEEALLAAVAEARRLRSAHVEAAALSELALLAAAADDHQEADRLALAAADACPALGDSYPTHALALATAARALIRHGKQDHARARLAEARHLSSLLGSRSFSWLALQARLELGHAYLTLRDLGDAETMLSELEEIRAATGPVGALDTAVDAFRGDLEAARPDAGHATSGLTPAELRLLPLLATHLSFREIGDRLFVSRNTVKTQAISVYRKLGVSARSTAIERAIELGLIEPSIPAPRGFTPSG
jgi:LuxR family maltose regulon positive regulatory protein